jgi:acyl carrier protein
MDVTTTSRRSAVEEVHAVMVRAALASQLEVPADSLGETQELERDLGLDPLDLVMVILRVEEAVGVEFPIALLDEAKTVGDVFTLVRSWLGVLPVLQRAAARAKASTRARSDERARARMRTGTQSRRRAARAPSRPARSRYEP